MTDSGLIWPEIRVYFCYTIYVFDQNVSEIASETKFLFQTAIFATKNR